MNWHYETLEHFGIYEEQIPKIKKQNPALYSDILLVEFYLHCEDLHKMLNFTDWKEKYKL